MSRAGWDPHGWELAPAASMAVRSEPDGWMALTLQITRHGDPFVTAPLRLTVAEAERIHAALCYALGRKPAPGDAPECRKPNQYSGGRQRY